MLTSSEITDAPREAARAMLQLLFLMVHSLADLITARQVLADNQNSRQPARTRSKRKLSAAASRLLMLKLEDNIVNLKTYLSTLPTWQPSAHAQQLATMILMFTVCIRWSMKTFQCCSSLPCPNMSTHNDAFVCVNHLVQSVCSFVKQMCMFPSWLHGHSQAQSMQVTTAKTCNVWLHATLFVPFSRPLLHPSQMCLWHSPCQSTPLGVQLVSHVSACWLIGLEFRHT